MRTVVAAATVFDSAGHAVLSILFRLPKKLITLTFFRSLFGLKTPCRESPPFVYTWCRMGFPFCGEG